MDALLVTLDECTRCVVREVTTQVAKAVNGTAATAVSLLTQQRYYATLRESFTLNAQRSKAPPVFAVSEPSSLNAVALSPAAATDTPATELSLSSGRSSGASAVANASAAGKTKQQQQQQSSSASSDTSLRVHTTSSRRGWGEDFQLYLELLIARLFLLLRSIVQMVVSIATLRSMHSRASATRRQQLLSLRQPTSIPAADVRGNPCASNADVPDDASDTDDSLWIVPPSRQQREQLSEEVPAHGAPQPLALLAGALFGEDAAMHDESRSTEDFIRAAGYTYECLRCVTADGYVVYMHRIPNKASSRSVLFAHGLADSGLGWVSGGITSSHAFAASDEGLDVFLADFRGAPPREHVNSNLSSTEYWYFTLDELGLEDLYACVREIQSLKHRERKDVSPSLDSLKLVAHSTGCIAAMEYAVMCSIRGVEHGLSGVVLLCPAGFHAHKLPFLFYPMMILDTLFRRQMLALTPGVYIPTKLLRLLMNKLTQDLQNIPAVAELVKVVIGSGLFGGDASDWTQALAMPHYNVKGMPGVSLLMLLHFEQLWKSNSFSTFDWRNFNSIKRIVRRAAMRNRSPISPAAGEVIDIGAHYGYIDVPVDLIGGTTDYVVAPDNVVEHQRRLSEAGVANTIRWFTLAHLDVIHRPPADLRSHVLSCLLRR